MNKNSHSHRKKGGELDTSAGLIPDLDALVKEYLGAPTATRPNLLASASAIAATFNSSVSDGVAGAACAYTKSLS